MLRSLRAVVVLGLLSAVVGCSGDDDGGASSETVPSSAPVPVREACGGLLGRQGSVALAELAEEQQVIPVHNDAPGLLKKVASEMVGMTPQQISESEKPKNICTFKAPASNEFSRKTVKLDYGWSAPPAKTEKRHFYYAAGSALIDDYYFDHVTPTSIYYRCLLREGESGVVRGRINAKWTADYTKAETDERIARILLHAAGEMSEALGCTNSPQLAPDSRVTAIVDTPGGMKPGLPLPSPPASGPLKR